jgi:hypothetical protein
LAGGAGCGAADLRRRLRECQYPGLERHGRRPDLGWPGSFRLSDLDLRDPHVFVDLPIFGCTDFTDQDLPLGLGPSLNGQIETAVTTDGDGDDLLDASFVLLFRPFATPATQQRMETGSARCSAPIAGTSCAAVAGAPPTTTRYSTQTSGLCLDIEPGTTSGYTPGVGAPNGPCLATEPRSGTIDLGAIAIPLLDLQLGAAFGGAPVDLLSNGLMRGFLSEAAAEAILLPADLPLVGGQPLAILLPGGNGNCAGHDARDTHNGEPGWWFYLNFPAARVAYTGL